MIRRIKAWNAWRECQVTFSPFEKILVLLGLCESWSFDWYLAFYDEEDKT